MPSLPLRIAILECGAPSPNTAKRYGGYGGVFTSLLETAASELSSPDFTLSSSDLSISIFDIKHAPGSYPSLDDVDGVLLTGSASNSFDNDEWIIKLVTFVSKVLTQRRVRTVGVCFGHQIVARALGARVGRSGKGWETAVTEMELTEKGREIFRKKNLALHQSHQDEVYECPPGAELLAYTDKCPVHAMYIPKRVITVQGHPEFTEEIMRDLLDAKHAQEIFGKESYEDALKRVHKDHDGVVVAQAFLRFLLQE